MTKSIEEQADEYAMGDGATIEKRKCFTVDLHLGNPQQYEYVKIYNNNSYRDFLAGAKARDEQWLKVVSELRKAVHCDYGCRVNQDHGWKVVKCNCGSEEARAKADQMLKEMEIK